MGMGKDIELYSTTYWTKLAPC